MPVKTKRVHKPRVEFWRLRRPGQLTPEESTNVLIALEYMVARVGGGQALAYRMGIDRTCVRRALKERPTPGAVIAWELSRVAQVPVEDIIAGKYPPPGSCPHCGGLPWRDGHTAEG